METSGDTRDYIHGYTPFEQSRLIRQGDYWRDKLILRDLSLPAGASLLEIGCGVGAVLGILGQTFEGLQLAGIDLQRKQIDFAHHYLQDLGLADVTLKVGNIEALPWGNETFDYVYGIWILEHIKHPLPALKEAYRVLKLEGKIFLNETDLKTLLIYPESSDFYYLQQGLWDLLAESGNPYVARRLGYLLEEVGFQEVNIQPWGFHFRQEALREFVDYVDEWLAPTLPQMVEKLGKNQRQLEAGLSFFRHLPNDPEGSATIVIYRAEAKK